MQHQPAGPEATGCLSCGTDVPDEAAFCPGCGAPAPTTSGERRATGLGGVPALPGYTVLEAVGSGGSSIVYRARQDNLDRQVAVKLIRQELDDPKAWRRFEREARIIASLSGHPNVVTIYDVGRTEAGQPFLVTEWLDRGSLSDVLQAEGPLDGLAAVGVGRAVAEGVAAAHERGILHRDLKPGNVLLDARGHIKLADFGVARLMAGHSQTTTGSIAFTPEHVAPEVLRGEAEGPASDVYGLGSTVATALVGRSPFARRPDERVEAVMWRKLAEPAPPLPASVPADLADLLAQCLASAPADRPPLDVVRHRLAVVAERRAAPPSPGLGATIRQAPADRSHDGARTAAAPAPIPAGTAPVAAAASPRPDPPSKQPERRDTAVGAAPLPAPVEADDLPSGWARRSRWLLVATVVVVLVFVAGLASLGDRDGDDGNESASIATDGSGPTTAPAADPASPPEGDDGPAPAPPPTATPTTRPTTAPTTAAPTTAAPTTAAPTTAAPTTAAPATAAPTTAPTTAAQRPPDAGRPGPDEATAFVRDYYDEVEADDLESSWAKLSPEFRAARNLSFERYARYWRNTSIEVDNIRYEQGPGPEQARVRFDARYVSFGRVIEETDELTLRRSNGELLITDQRIVE